MPALNLFLHRATGPLRDNLHFPHEREELLDLARILAATLLFYFHTGLFCHWPANGIATNGTFVFIFLSSFCAARFSKNRIILQSWLAFPLSRIRRLYLTYWMVSFVIFLGSFIHPAVSKTSPFGWSDLLMNLFGLNQYFGDRYLSRTMWFVPFVVQIYFLLPLFLRMPFAPVTTMVGCFAVSTLACMAVFAISPDYAGEICRAWSPIFRLPPVYLGVAMAMSASLAQKGAVVTTFAVCSGLLTLVAPYWPDMAPTLARPGWGLLMGLSVAAVSWLISASVKARAGIQSLVTLLGKASYPFFLIHGVMIAWVWETFGRQPLIWGGYFIACWAIAISIGRLEQQLRTLLASVEMWLSSSARAEE